MRAVLAVLMFVPIHALAAPPSAYQCSPGTAVAGVGCKCPEGQREKRDAEDTATCIVVTKPQANPTPQFVKALADGNLDRAADLASSIDGATDKKAMDALVAAFTTWFAEATTEAAKLGPGGHCAALKTVPWRGEEYRRIFEALMTRLKTRTPAIDPVAMMGTLIEGKLLPFQDALRACIDAASKEDGSERIAKSVFADRAGINKCNAMLKGTTVDVDLVIDADGKRVRWNVSPPQANAIKECLAPVMPKLFPASEHGYGGKLHFGPDGVTSKPGGNR